MADKELAVKVKVKLDTSKTALQKELNGTDQGSVQSIVSKLSPIKIPVTIDKKALEASIKAAFGNDSLKKLKESISSPLSELSKTGTQIKNTGIDEQIKKSKELTEAYRNLVEAEKERVVWEQKLAAAKVSPNTKAKEIEELNSNLSDVYAKIYEYQTKVAALSTDVTNSQKHTELLNYLDRKTSYAEGRAADQESSAKSAEQAKKEAAALKEVNQAIDQQTNAWKKLMQAKTVGNESNVVLYQDEYRKATSNRVDKENAAENIIGPDWKNAEYYAKVEKSQVAVKDSTNQLNAALNKQSEAVKGLSAKWTNIETSYNKIEKQTPELTASYNNLSKILNDNSLGDSEKLKQFNDELARFNALVRSNSASNTKNTQSIANDIAYNNLYAKALEFTQQNQRVLSDKNLGSGFSTLLATLKSGEGDVRELSKEFSNLRAQSIEAGLATETLGEKIKKLWNEHLKTAMVMAGIHMIQQGLQQVYTNVVQIDTAMTELKKVTDETDQSYTQFTSRAAKQARELGVSISDYVQTTADWARLGYNLADSEELARVSSLFKNVGDGIESASEASSYLISTLKGFNLVADDAEHVLDVINEVANTEPVSAQNLGTILQKSAAAMSAAGNTFEETIALGTAMNSVLQNADQTGKFCPVMW